MTNIAEKVKILNSQLIQWSKGFAFAPSINAEYKFIMTKISEDPELQEALDDGVIDTKCEGAYYGWKVVEVEA